MSLRERLYPYQLEDIVKLENQPGRLICSGMGTGKTLQGSVLSTDADETLVVAPLGTHDAWVRWLGENNIDAVKVNPKARATSHRAFMSLNRHHRAYVVHWEGLRLMPELKEYGRWDHIIADECQKMQNRKSQQTRALKGLRAAYRTGLSGTAVTGAPASFWSALNWMYPELFRSYWKFYAQYTDFEIVYPQGYHKIKGPKNEHVLHELIDPFYVRHLKKEQCCPHHPQGVMPWLPDKSYTTVFVDLTPQQRRAYDAMKKEMVAWVGAHEQTPLVASVVVAQLRRLEQFADAYAEVTPEGVRLTEPSAKLDRLQEIIEDNPNENIVVFSQFKQPLYLMAKRLEKLGVSYGLYTGDNRSTRDDVRERFARGELRVFLGVIAAGGVGIDGLQGASSTVVFLDREWNPANNEQAEDRLHRDGQRNPVQVIDIVARNTIDLGRRQRLAEKWDWIRRLLGDTTTLQAEELKAG